MEWICNVGERGGRGSLNRKKFEGEMKFDDVQYV